MADFSFSRQENQVHRWGMSFEFLGEGIAKFTRQPDVEDRNVCSGGSEIVGCIFARPIRIDHYPPTTQQLGNRLSDIWIIFEV